MVEGAGVADEKSIKFASAFRVLRKSKAESPQRSRSQVTRCRRRCWSSATGKFEQRGGAWGTPRRPPVGDQETAMLASTLSIAGSANL